MYRHIPNNRKYDQVSNSQINQWQQSPLMQWMWESYRISSKLYAEIDAMKGNYTLDENYYKAHLPIVQQRVEQAGVRLAGLLNQAFKGATAQ